MANKFENKQLNKNDHAKVDKEATAARIAVGGIAVLITAECIPWEKIKNTVVSTRKNTKA